MPSNTDRRAALADAAVAVVAADGLRGLTHRAVDARAGVPTGTASNYFRTRDALVEATARAALARLRTRPEDRDRLRGAPAGIDTLVAHLRAYSRACLADRAATRAWFELRLHAARGGAIAALVAERQAHNLAFAAERQLPGSPDEHRRLSDAVDGVLLSAVTGTASDAQVVADVEAFVRALVPAGGRRWFNLR